MDLQKTKISVMSTDQVFDLYNIEIELVEYIGDLHRSIIMCETNIEGSEYRAKLSLANTLLSICRERQGEMKDFGARINYNFRMAAKGMLKKEIYSKIYEAAKMPRREIKNNKDYREKNLS